MKKISLFTLLNLYALAFMAQSPTTKKVEQTDDYFGVKVSDPYRWLEDDNSKETAEWVKAQNTYTQSYLSKIPFKEQVKTRLTEIWNYEKQTAPYTKAGKKFFYKNDGIQNQSVLYVQDNEKSNPRVLLDPNKLSNDGTISITSDGISKSGKYYAYAYAKAGSDWNNIRIIDIQTLKQVDEEIEWIKFSGIEWNGDDGFYYSKYVKPEVGKELSASNENQKVVYHKLGTKQKYDNVVYADPANPKRSFYAGLSDNEEYLIITGTESTTGNSLYLKKRTGKDTSLIKLIDNFDNEHQLIEVFGTTAIIVTNHKASNKRVVSVDLSNPNFDKAVELIPESKDLLESVVYTSKRFIINYLHDVTSRMEVRDVEGKLLYNVKLPDIGKVNAINFEKSNPLGYVDFTTFTSPTAIYSLNVNKGELNLVFKPKVNFDSEKYETKQVFYPSMDGTQIPMFIIAKKGIKLDGTNPCFLFGYGGFSAYYAPEFRIDRCIFLEQGGVYAVPGLRGGGEYGEDWHKAGTILNKQNVFDDFISAAEYLCEQKYTSKEKLAIHGRSNGGLLIGAVMTQRPDLCKVAIPTVGVLDMLRYHKFTIGWAWATDYGTSENEEQFNYLYKYSPLHNVKKVEYPATLVLTGDHDDRVVPAHSFKFGATLQENNISKEPIIIRVDTNAGHGAGKPTSKQIAEYSDMWSFVFYNLGVKPSYLKK
jgi:prolyl oligopeptidase